jgi:biotin transporter BioY
MSFIVGVPLYFILRLRHWTSWLAYMSAAYVMGVIATPVAGLIWVFWRTRSWLLVVQTGSNLPTILPDVLLTSLLATPIGLLFWLIVRPDRRG